MTLLETLSVPVDGSSVRSTTTLTSGQLYRFRASGTFIIGGPGFADAEYSFPANNSFSFNNCNNSPSGVDLGIGISDSINDNSKFPFWGAFNPLHVYDTVMVGQGFPVDLNYHDCNYGDNSGSLTVEIFGPAAGPPPSTPTATPTSTSTVTPTPTRTPGPATVFVAASVPPGTSNDPLPLSRGAAMTFTRLQVRTGDCLVFAATGLAAGGPGFELLDATGIPGAPRSGSGFPDIVGVPANLYSLIGTIHNSDATFTGVGDQWFLVGTQRSLVADRDGELVLLFHDAIYRSF
jgi:hypothetical protein